MKGREVVVLAVVLLVLFLGTKNACRTDYYDEDEENEDELHCLFHHYSQYHWY